MQEAECGSEEKRVCIMNHPTVALSINWGDLKAKQSLTFTWVKKKIPTQLKHDLGSSLFTHRKLLQMVGSEKKFFYFKVNNQKGQIRITYRDTTIKN